MGEITEVTYMYRVIHNVFGVWVFIYADVVESRTIAQIKA